jgi:hypothetical protein
MQLFDKGNLYDLYEDNNDKCNFWVRQLGSRGDTRYHVKNYDLDYEIAICDIYKNGILNKIDFEVKDNQEIYVVIIPVRKRNDKQKF